jgi:hypothetical protein
MWRTSPKITGGKARSPTYNPKSTGMARPGTTQTEPASSGAARVWHTLLARGCFRFLLHLCSSLRGEVCSIVQTRASYSRVQQHHEILGRPDRSKSQQLVSYLSNKRSIRGGAEGYNAALLHLDRLKEGATWRRLLRRTSENPTFPRTPMNMGRKGPEPTERDSPLRYSTLRE